jgi:GntR family transcriptional regulator/MocR family aminotransferase
MTEVAMRIPIADARIYDRVGGIARRAARYPRPGLEPRRGMAPRVEHRRHERAIAAAAVERFVGLYPMSNYKSRPAERPPQLVLGFGSLTEGASARSIDDQASGCDVVPALI